MFEILIMLLIHLKKFLKLIILIETIFDNSKRNVQKYINIIIDTIDPYSSDITAIT